MASTYRVGDEPVPGYRLTDFLGRGGFGEVWKARAPGGTLVALKIINLQKQRGLREFRAIRLVKRIRHPNLTPINAFWLKDQNGKVVDENFDDAELASEQNEKVAAGPRRAAELLIAMGLGDFNLFDRLEECKRQGMKGVPVGELLGYMEDSARGLDYLNTPQHELGAGPSAIQHCDVKPQNLLAVGGSVQVCDFGLARALGDLKSAAAAGSPAYGAPECIQNRQPSHATDQYSLAISYFELRTGDLPFEYSSYTGVIEAHLKGNLDFSKLPPAEQAVVKRAAALDPDDRYPTVGEFVRDLKAAVFEGRKAGANSPNRPFDEDDEIVPGYKLVRQIFRDGSDEVWVALAPGGRSIAMLIRDLKHARGSLDLLALTLVQQIEHRHLTELHAFWLLDERNEIVPDELRMLPSGPTPAKLVIAGKLARKSLLDRLDEANRTGEAGLNAHEALRYVRQAAEALDFLNAQRHRYGDQVYAIQHRNVRPVNMLLYGDEVRLGNFSFAKSIQGEGTSIPQGVKGLNHAYAAPEILNGHLTRWSDQYSLALVYVELRTGSLPFRSATSSVAVRKHQLQGDLELGSLPQSEGAIVARAASLVPEQRFASCRDFVDSLAHVIRDGDAAAPALANATVTMSAGGATTRVEPPVKKEEVRGTDSAEEDEARDTVISEEDRPPPPKPRFQGGFRPLPLPPPREPFWSGLWKAVSGWWGKKK